MGKQEYTCKVEFTEGWQERFTKAFVDLYYRRLEQGKERPKEDDRASA